jgi:hypothetical protein
MNKDIYESLGDLSLRVFSQAGPIDHLRKLKEEADEAIEDTSDIMEYVDCLLALYAAAYKAGFTYEDMVKSSNDKMEILKQRKWMIREDGIYQHIKD